jgi:hypothetical protein
MQSDRMLEMGFLRRKKFAEYVQRRRGPFELEKRKEMRDLRFGAGRERYPR